MGTRLLNMAVSMDLLEVNRGRYVLTEFGRENLEIESVFVPEKSTWTVWVADDPLIPASVIHVERHKEGRPDKNRKDTQVLPATLLALNDTKVDLLRPHHTKDTQMRIKRVEEKGRSGVKTELTHSRRCWAGNNPSSQRDFGYWKIQQNQSRIHSMRPLIHNCSRC